MALGRVSAALLWGFFVWDPLRMVLFSSKDGREDLGSHIPPMALQSLWAVPKGTMWGPGVGELPFCLATSS